MPEDLSPSENEALEQWIAAVRAALDAPGAVFPIDDVLGLMGSVAHRVVRPAVPPTAYLIGYHVGRAVAAGEDQQQALHRALGSVAELVSESPELPKSPEPPESREEN